MYRFNSMDWFNGLARLRDMAGRAGRTVLDTLYPLECVGCGRSGRVICEACAADLPELTSPFCGICATPGDFARCPRCAAGGRQFDGIRAPYHYAGAVRQAILALKYDGIKAAAAQLGDLLAGYLNDNPLPGDVLTAVPMHSRRRRERGYNQAELLAVRVARAGNLGYDAGLLTRTRPVEPQAGMDSADRRAVNVADSVAVSPGKDLNGAAIILVDDVATTGSTLESCATALKQAGAASVWCLTLAVAGGQPLRE